VVAKIYAMNCILIAFKCFCKVLHKCRGLSKFPSETVMSCIPRPNQRIVGLSGPIAWWYTKITNLFSGWLKTMLSSSLVHLSSRYYVCWLWPSSLFIYVPASSSTSRFLPLSSYAFSKY
jgi:hypothetical protein